MDEQGFAVKDAKSMPRIDETLDMLRGDTVYSTLDLMSGYWQTELTEESKQMTASTSGPRASMNGMGYLLVCAIVV